MSALWNQTTEDVFRNEGIAAELYHFYPNVYNLLRDEPGSTTAYLNLQASIKSIPYQYSFTENLSLENGSNGMYDGSKGTRNIHIIVENLFHDITETVQKRLSSLLPHGVSRGAAMSIAHKCLNELRPFGVYPALEYSQSLTRESGTYDLASDVLIWSISYELRLNETMVYNNSKLAWRGPAAVTGKEYSVNGTLTVFQLCCNKNFIDSLEKRAWNNYHKTKQEILHVWPHMSITSTLEHPSVIQNSYFPRDPDYKKDGLNYQIRENLSLEKSIYQMENCVVTILTITESRSNGLTATDFIAYALKDIKSFIEMNIPNGQKTFIVNNHLVVVYSLNNPKLVWGVLGEIQFNRQSYFLQSLKDLESTHECTIDLETVKYATFSGIMRRIHNRK